MDKPSKKLSEALWRIYNRPERPIAWAQGGNLPWDDPDFSQRMLHEHLDQTHGAASRTIPERDAQIEWLWDKLNLQAEQHLLDVTCGPGLYAVDLARHKMMVTGVDFSPASIAYGRNLAQEVGVSDRCHFIQQDVRQMELTAATFDAALLLYGQLAVFTKEEAHTLLTQIAHALRPGARLCVELLNPDRIDKEDSNWWFTDDSGLWGDAPFLHLGERFWDADKAISIERFYTLHLENGRCDEIHLCDQLYTPSEIITLMKSAGFHQIDLYPAWDSLPLYDATEWLVYIATK